MTNPVDELAARVVNEHLIIGPRTGQCLCGWGDGGDILTLGRPHAAHLVEKLREAGVLKETAESDYQLWLTALVDQAVDGVTHVFPEHLDSVRDNGTQLFVRVESDGTIRLEAATL